MGQHADFIILSVLKAVGMGHFVMVVVGLVSGFCTFNFGSDRPWPGCIRLVLPPRPRARNHLTGHAQKVSANCRLDCGDEEGVAGLTRGRTLCDSLSPSLFPLIQGGFLRACAKWTTL